jgi:Ser/Thr protein kinase RdoA (MazF antagonist)
VCAERFGQSAGVRYLRVHGDCHAGNLLWRDEAPHFVDFDDARMAPAIQDLWMLLSGPAHEQQAQLTAIVEGYDEFADFDYRELALIEPLRTLRMLHYAAWLARRWDDPAFPRAFPWFNTQAYWERHVLELREQFAAMSDPAWGGGLLH